MVKKDTQNSSYRRKKFWQNLKEVRREKYAKRKDFAAALGIPYPTYSQYENGKRQPDYELLMKICELLDVTTDRLLIGPDTDSNKISHCLAQIINKDRENIEKVEGDAPGWIIHNTYGEIKLSAEEGVKIIQEAKTAYDKYIIVELEKRLEKQRSLLYGDNSFAKIEGKILCANLNYDMDIIKSIASRIYEMDELYIGVIQLIYFFYFTGINLCEDVDLLYKKYMIYKTVIDRDVFHFNPEIKISYEMLSSGLFRDNDCGYRDERDIWRSLDKYCPQEINSTVDLYLRQHWGVSDGISAQYEEMSFRQMRYLFFRFGLADLNKVHHRGEYEAKARKYMFWCGHGEEL